jgi:exosortase
LVDSFLSGRKEEKSKGEIAASLTLLAMTADDEKILMIKLKELIGESAGQVDVKRSLLFVAALGALVVYGPIREYLLWTYKSMYYTHVVLIPLVSAYLVFARRKEIFADIGCAFAQGGAVIGLGLLLLAAASTTAGWGKNDQYALVACSTVLVVIGAFIALFGLRTFQAARFPMLFLAFMVPLPSAVEYWVIRILQIGSTEFVALLFSITPVPVLRDGFVFHMPGLSIEVAPQCSGIRSSLALVITAVLAGHMFLQTTWKKVLLALAVIPITMLKNGIRIVTLSLLGLYVDKGFLESSLHRDGGIFFFILALCLMAPILFVLRKGEKRLAASVLSRK